MVDVQDRITDEKHGDADGDECKSAHVNQTTSGHQVCACHSRILVGRIGIVEVIVFFDIFWKEKQAGRRENVVFFGDGLGVDALVITSGS